MARAPRCGFTVLEVLDSTVGSIEAIIARVEGINLSWVESGAGALGAPWVCRRLIYIVQSLPCGMRVDGVDGLRRECV